MHYQVVAVSGSVVGTWKTRDEAVAMAKVYGLPEDRVFEVRKRDGWVSLAFGIVTLVGWAYFVFELQLWRQDWPALIGSPGLTLGLGFGLPIVAIISIAKAIDQIRRVGRE